MFQRNIPSLALFRHQTLQSLIVETLLNQDQWWNLTTLFVLILSIAFGVPLLVLVCIQTKNMINDETTAERN